MGQLTEYPDNDTAAGIYFEDTERTFIVNCKLIGYPTPSNLGIPECTMSCYRYFVPSRRVECPKINGQNRKAMRFTLRFGKNYTVISDRHTLFIE